MTTPVSGPRIRLFSRAGCHLCDDSRAIIAAVCAQVGEEFVEVDIDTDPDLDPALLARFTEEVPVTFVDGRQHDFWRVDPDRLRAALTS